MDDNQVTITNAYTTSTPDLRELHSIVKHMRSNTAPGPDGLNAAFYKATWSWIGIDLHQVVSYFYQTSQLPTNISNTVIALIHKINTPGTQKTFALLVYAMSTTKLLLKLWLIASNITSPISFT
jgi:hypothetical protein